jgi:hypothetical protein
MPTGAGPFTPGAPDRAETLTAHGVGSRAEIIAFNLLPQRNTQEAIGIMVPGATINAMSNTPPAQLRVFAFKDVVRFSCRFRIPDEGIWDVVRFQPDADLGGGLYKY